MSGDNSFQSKRNWRWVWQYVVEATERLAEIQSHKTFQGKTTAIGLRQDEDWKKVA